MSNLETAPPELACASPAASPAADRGVQVLEPRAVPLGGPRAMTVRRTLPQRARSLIGAWCFADHYGPDDVSATGGMQVAGHPVGGAAAGAGQLIYAPPGAGTLGLRAHGGQQARVLLLGGAPLGEQIIMWWNFIARSHDEIVAYRAQWQAERAGNLPAGARRYGRFPAQWDHTLPAPELPGTRLRPRG